MSDPEESEVINDDGVDVLGILSADSVQDYLSSVARMPYLFKRFDQSSERHKIDSSATGRRAVSFNCS